MARAADTYADAPIERQPGQFARHPKTGAPWVAHPTETTKVDGKKADLIVLCAARGIEVPEKVTVPQLQALLGPRPIRVQYGRPSSLGKQIENMTNIQKWSERAVALGIFLDYSLIAELRELDPDQLNLDDAAARDILDRIAVHAKNTAQAGLAADRGTHHHELTEDHDTEQDWIERSRRGEDLGVPHHVQAALVAAWSQMHEKFDIEILAVEATCVDDIWRQAGTLDRICRLRRELTFVTVMGEYVTLPAGWVGILDLKTGKLRLDRSGFVSYWHGYAVQLASYAHSVPYDPDTDQRSEWPWPIDQQWAVIAHLDVLAALAGEAVCRLVLVDLEAGRHAGELCVASHAWEKRTDVFSIPTDELAVRVPVTTNAVGGADDREESDGQPAGETPPAATDVASAPPAPEPPRAAPDAPTSEPSEVAPCEADATTIESPEQILPPAPETEIAPPQEDPVPPAVADKPPSPLRQAQLDRQASVERAEAKRRLYGQLEDGAPSDDRTFLALQHRHERLSAEAKAWMKLLGEQAENAKVGFSSRTAKTVRRFEILRALIVCAEHEETDEQVRGWLALVDPKIALLDAVPLGQIVGSLSATEAATFAQLVTDQLTVVFRDDGTTTLAPNRAA